MTAILYLLPISLVLGGLALIAFIWSVRTHQYDDLEREKYRVLNDAPPLNSNRTWTTDGASDRDGVEEE